MRRRRERRKAEAPLIKKKKSSRSSSSSPSNNILDRLPQDLIVDIMAQLADGSPSPRADLGSVRATCRSFRAAAGARDVARRVRMEKEQNLRWSNKDRYLFELESFASLGNVDAQYLLGLEYIFGGASKTYGSSGNDDLDIHQGSKFLARAAKAGYDVAIYAAGIWLFRLGHVNEETRQWGVDVLNDLENKLHGEDRAPHCTSSVDVEKCRKKVSSAIGSITMKQHYFSPLAVGAVCTNSACGQTTKNPAVGGNWSAFRQQQFCSQLCRWRDEYCKFFRSLHPNI